MSELLDVKTLTPYKNGRKKSFIYRLTLPQEWVKEQGLVKGGRVVISESDGKLIIEKTERMSDSTV